ncbi:MAG: hypothetical protein QNJ30_25725 [Kiloniellales bacterium]|nr:hypothetical protein [Kiloniellales bacterium]
MTNDRFDSEEGETAMTAEDRALWQKARNGWAGGSEAADDVDPLLLAAYLDGRLDAEEAAALEARLAADPVALDLMAASRGALAAGPAEAVPESLLRRAEGLVRPAPAAPRKGRLAGLAAAFLMPGQAAWAGFAAAVMLASLAGFELGQIGLDNAAIVTSALGEEVRHGLDPLNGPLL